MRALLAVPFAAALSLAAASARADDAPWRLHLDMGSGFVDAHEASSQGRQATYGGVFQMGVWVLHDAGHARRVFLGGGLDILLGGGHRNDGGVFIDETMLAGRVELRPVKDEPFYVAVSPGCALLVLSKQSDSGTMFGPTARFEMGTVVEGDEDNDKGGIKVSAWGVMLPYLIGTRKDGQTSDAPQYALTGMGFAAGVSFGGLFAF